jgi:hypothetical protein
MSMADIFVEISPGELMDKITILQIKSDNITDSSKLKNVVYELKVLTESLTKHVSMTETLNQLFSELKKVNQELWTIEDDIRVCEKKSDFSKQFIDLARAVYVTNDKRADLKKKINLELNSAIVEEKSYEEYK